MDNPNFIEVSKSMVERYSKRYNNLGYDVQTLGWGSVEQQNYRFEQTLSEIQFDKNKTILDIGCGFGDYLKVLKENQKEFKKYIGWDINLNLIQESQKIWKKEKNVSFKVKNIGDKDAKITQTADVAIMLGLLNLNLKNKIDNYEYSFAFIKNAFTYVKEVLVIDFLSTVYSSDYPQEDFVFYHEPAKILDFALTLSPNVVLKHNYAPIPQKEFMLFIYK